MARSPERQELVTQHLGLVRAIAVQMRKKLASHIELDDLISLGTTGLLEAADRYEPHHGSQFSTFAYYRIRGAIGDGLRKMGSLGRTAYRQLRMQQAASDYLREIAARDGEARIQGVAPSENSAASQSSPAANALAEMAELLTSVATVFVTSLDAQRERAHEVPDRAQAPADEQLSLGQESSLVRRAIQALPERERHFLIAHYFEDKTLTEAGESLGLSRSWSSRLHARAIDLLRDELTRQKLPTK